MSTSSWWRKPLPLYFCFEGTILFAVRKFFYSPTAKNVKRYKKLTLHNRGEITLYHADTKKRHKINVTMRQRVAHSLSCSYCYNRLLRHSHSPHPTHINPPPFIQDTTKKTNSVCCVQLKNNECTYHVWRLLASHHCFPSKNAPSIVLFCLMKIHADEHYSQVFEFEVTRGRCSNSNAWTVSL